MTNRPAPPAWTRPGWPLLLLLASIALTAVAAWNAQRTARSHRAVVESALREYAGFAAWSYREHLQVWLDGAARDALGAVNHEDEMHTSPRVPHARDLAHYLTWDAECGCHQADSGVNPGIFFGFTLGSDTLGVGVNTFRDPARGWEVDRPAPADQRGGGIGVYTAAERAWVVDTLTAQVRSGLRDDRGYAFLVGGFGGRPRFLAYTLMPTAWGDTLVYGAEYTREEIGRGLAWVLDGQGLLPASFTRRRANREVVAVQVSTAGGGVLFDSSPGLAWSLDARQRLPAALGGVVIRAQVLPERAGEVVIGGVPASRLPFLTGLLVLAAALSLVAMAQLRRERGFLRSRTDFVASVSHELRTPLAQIRLFLETLRLGRFTTEEQRAWSLDCIDRETRRLAYLVENVLLFSRPGRGAPPERADLAAEVERVVEEFRPLAASRRATLEVEAAADGVPPVRLRRDAFRQVLLNLLDNAVKYGPAGQTVRVRVERAASGAARVVVADQGPGVPPGEREAVWRPFHRGSGPAARSVGGSGIGLTVARGIVEEHGGRARVEDAPGGGAAFVVELPAAPAAEEGALPPALAGAGR